MMNEIMKRGKIECDCGNTFYFESLKKEILCMKCGKMHKNEGEPVQEEETPEEGD